MRPFTAQTCALLAIVVAGSGRTAAQTDVQHECIAHHAAGSIATAGKARFVMEHDDPRFRVRGATLTRRVMCGFREGRVIHATDRFYLRLVSQDREDPGFSTGAPNHSRRFYLECEGAVGTTLATFVAGQVLTFAGNSFTLPCGHMIYPKGVSDPVRAERVTGAYTYRVQSATWRVRRGPTPGHPSFEVAVDALVANPVETLRLRGVLSGELTTVHTIVDCPVGHSYTKRPTHPACN